MKSILLVGLFGAFITLSCAAKSSGDGSNPETRADVTRGQERGDHKHGAHSESHGHAVYHETHGQELFQGENWMLIPILLIPLLILGCYFMWGGSGDEGWGWDRMGYSDNSVGGAYSNYGYDTRSFSPADAFDKTMHQRIMNSIQTP